VPDNPRIDELRRRVDKDPASIAFAQLAEEYRRAGENDEAIRVCRAGLEQHPGYLSARVTLGRALLEIGQFDEAQAELEQVIRVAPDNLAAIRALAEIHQRREEGGAPAAEPAEPELPAAIAPLPDLDLAFNGSEDQFAEALKSLGGDSPIDLPGPGPMLIEERLPPTDPVIEELDEWLQAILADRESRGRSTGRHD
jgi:tetratricopeptide (TPR) repeat protein